MKVTSFQSGPSGGKGGDPFTDDVPADGVKIQSVFIQHGDWVNALQLYYSDGSATDLHGQINGGNPTTILFKPDETLVEIYGTYGDYINSINLRTNVQTYGPYGRIGNDKNDKTYRYQELEDALEIVGLFGASGNFLDAFGVIRRQKANGRHAEALAPSQT